MKRSRTQNSFINVMTGMGGYIINTLLGIVCRMVFTRTLSTDYLGISGLFGDVLKMLSLAELGIGSAIVYALYKPLAVDDKEKIASLVKFYGKCYRLIGVIVAVVGVALLPFLNIIVKEPPNISENLYVIYLVYIFNTSSTYFFSYRSSLLSAAQQNYLVVGLSYIQTILQSILQMIVLYTTHNYMLYLMIQIVGIFIYNVTISYVAKKKFPYIADKDIKPLKKEEKKGLFDNVRYLIVIKVCGMLVNSTDNMIISYFKGLSTVGLSSNYTLLSSTLNALLVQVFNGINASIGNHNALEDKAKRKKLFDCVNFANFWLFGWAAIGIVVCSTDIVKVFFGENYVLGISIPIALAVNFYIQGMQNAVWSYKNTLGLFKYGRYLLIATAILNLGLSIWWGNKWGLFGIYLATSVSRLLTNAWYDPYMVHKYAFGMKVWGYYAKYIVYAVIICITCGICYFTCSFIHISPIVDMLLKLIVCTIIPNLIFSLFFFRTEEFKYLKNTVLGFMNRFKKKISRS